MNTGKNTAQNQAHNLQFRSRRIVVALTDGREISVPLEFFPTLERANARDRADWQSIGDGQGFHWPALDLDLSVEGLIRGMREAIPTPPATGNKIVRRGASMRKMKKAIRVS